MKVLELFLNKFNIEIKQNESVIGNFSYILWDNNRYKICGSGNYENEIKDKIFEYLTVEYNYDKIALKNMFKLNLESKCEYIKYFKLLEDFNSEYLHLMMAYCKLKEFLSDFHIKYLIEFSSQLSWLREQDWVISHDFGLTLIDNDLLDYICNYNRKIEKDNIEKILHTDVIENFNKIFPEYTFIKEEYEVKNIGKIDILARDSRSNRDVVIEIKKDKGNPNKQLLAYANGFVNPILIGITNMNKKYYLDNIVYYTWKTIENKSKKR